LRRYQRIHSAAVGATALLQKGKESFKGKGLVSESPCMDILAKVLIRRYDFSRGKIIGVSPRGGESLRALE
jgi:hypothetical protein